MYLTSDENKFKLFNDLLPVSIVAPLNIEDEELTIVRMYQCKYLFDSAVYRSRGLLHEDGDMFADGKFIGNYKW